MRIQPLRQHIIIASSKGYARVCRTVNSFDTPLADRQSDDVCHDELQNRALCRL